MLNVPPPPPHIVWQINLTRSDKYVPFNQNKN